MGAGEQTVQRPAVGGVRDHEDSGSVPVGSEVTQEVISGGLDVAVALATGERFIDVSGPLGLDEGHRPAVELSVVAFTQAGVLVDGQWGVGEGDLRGLHGAVQIGGEDCDDAVVAAAAAAEFAGL